MRAIYRRELQSYFFTPTGYVFIGMFLALGSICFGVGNLADHSGNILNLLRMLSYIWMLLCPVLTMRLIAGERRLHTEQMLLSSPCSLTSIVLGKFFAAVTVLLFTVILSFLYPILVAIYGHLYLPETLVGYLGFFLQGLCYIAMDMMISALCKSTMTAVIACFGINLMMWLMDVIAAAVSIPFIQNVLEFIDLNQRFTPFAMGQLSFSGVLNNLLFVFMMLFLCVRILDTRRWSEA